MPNKPNWVYLRTRKMPTMFVIAIKVDEWKSNILLCKAINVDEQQQCCPSRNLYNKYNDNNEIEGKDAFDLMTSNKGGNAKIVNSAPTIYII